MVLVSIGPVLCFLFTVIYNCNYIAHRKTFKFNATCTVWFWWKTQTVWPGGCPAFSLRDMNSHRLAGELHTCLNASLKKKGDWLLPRKTTNVLRARNNYLCCSARSMPVVRELRQIAVLMHSVPWRWRGLIIVCSTGHLGVAKCLIRGGLCVRMPMAGARLRHLLLSHVFWQLPEGIFQSSYDLNSLHSIWISRFWIVVNQ